MKRLSIFILLCGFAALVWAADTTGLDRAVIDQGTGSNAILKLHDNHDGTKSVVVMAVIVTPTATFTPTATATSTPTATSTATFTPTPTPTP